MLIKTYSSYIIPCGQFSNYSPQYLSRSTPLYPLSYPECYYDYYGNWKYGYTGTSIHDIHNSELERMSLLSSGLEHLGHEIDHAVHHPPVCHGHTGYLTNKFDLELKIENDGWITAWADDIAEKDVLQGVVAAGVSVFSSNPSAFLYRINNLVNRTISSLQTDAQHKFTAEMRRVANEIAADVIRRAIQGKSPLETFKQFDTFDFKAGAIRYSGRNMLCGNTVSTTWGMKPYIALRVR
ncbi:hypothetical protein [Bacillus mycoides]|uniref:Uncharacterized protein n=1 Tax=Bacillus mycoides (strain KBAB4) TaxID=315730 RepID=A9VVB9_BACMK|nr:hypothetical protein [Bacillus mycoides]ABY46734.1 hypothetical protein BcerKBAB4_5382 [Bacillus mycoides KBAB4]EJQ60399.1 hypothetical protein IG7_05588 [Bacillus cereus HuA2-4]MED1054696.1 hypothetical protein [Bacillus mycoides]OSY04421.1 hypothetical protein S2E19_01755 [Bacillus mycoides]